MADVKTIQTRIINKHDSLANWNSSTVVLKEGEIALAYVETSKPNGHGGYYTIPTYLMKVGTGNKTFSQLEWLAAPASDVHEWAKKQNVTDVEEIAAVIGQANTNKGAISTLSGRVDDLEGLVGGNVTDLIKTAIEALDVTDTAVAGQFVTAVSEEDGKITVTRAALQASDIPTLGLDKIDGLVARFQAVEGDVATLKGQVGDGNVDTRIATAKGEAISAAATDATEKADAAKSAVIGTATDASTANTVYGAKKYAEEKAAAAESAAKSYADGLAGNYDEDGAAAAAEANAKTYAKNYADSLAGNYDAAGAAATAETNAKSYADEQLAAVVEQYLTGEGAADTIDTLQEIATWLNSDEAGASKIVADVAKNAQDIADEAGARAAADTALGNRITELEKIDHDHSNKAELDKILDGDVAKWNEAYSKRHEHSNKDVLDGIDSTKVGNWDSAEQNAKDYSDQQFTTKIASYSTTAQVEGFISTAKQEAAADATEKANGAKAAVIGASGDASTADTIYGAKKYADEKAAAAQSAAEGHADTKASEAQGAAKTYTDQEVKKVDDKVNALTTDNIAAGKEVWVFDCGTSSTVVD